ncbi:MAG: hypothetical protein HY721_26105 [Planctomycetes bacterium]|nr:hypothetical protein [Planctomycetota bacterium]
MAKKKLSEIRSELVALLAKLPDRSPREWLDREIESAKDDPDRDVETLEMLRAALEREARRGRALKKRRAAANR